MDTQNVTDIEAAEKIVWSTTRLYLSLLETFPKYVEDFQAKWNDWQQAISAADPSTWSSVPSFTALTALGPKIIPLVVYQLALNPTDTTAVHLYTTLETDPAYLPDPLLETNSGTQQQQQILALAFDRNRAVRNALADWTEHCERVSRHSTSAMYTECVEYDVLLQFGQSIIPQVMLQYAQDVEKQGRDGGVSASGIGKGVLFWYELLHELLWGRKTGAQTVQFGRVFDEWKGWFEEGGLRLRRGLGGCGLISVGDVLLGGGLDREFWRELV